MRTYVRPGTAVVTTLAVAVLGLVATTQGPAYSPDPVTAASSSGHTTSPSGVPSGDIDWPAQGG